MKNRTKSSNFRTFWYLHPHIVLAIGLILVNIIIVMIFSCILSLISGNSFIDEVTYCMILTMSADGIYDFTVDKDVAQLVVKLIMVLIQMILFSGALIGFITNVLENLFDKTMNNKGKLNLKNHYIILNWSSIGPNIVYDLSFLEGNKVVVILTEDDRDEVLNSINNIFSQNNRKRKNIRILVKEGDPSSSKHLEDISIENAKCVGILLSSKWVNDTSTNLEYSTCDLNAFKLLMSLVHLVKNSNIVIEVENNKMSQKIDALFNSLDNSNNNTISVFSHHSVTGLVIGKSVINKYYSDLYHEFLSYEGVEFYGIEPLNVEEALVKYTECIPVVNYDDDDVVDENNVKHADHLYVLSKDLSSIKERNQNISIKKDLPYRINYKKREFSLFIIGENSSLKYIIKELDEYKELTGININYHLFSYNDNLDEIVKKINSTLGEKKLLLLSNEDDIEIQDSNIFITLISLKLNNKISDDVEINVEIMNPNNFQSIKNLGVAKVIITNKIISLFMIQLLTHPQSRKFYNDILTANTESNNGAVDVEILSAEELFDFEKNLEFGSKTEFVNSFFIASNKTKCIIGYRHASQKDINFLCEDMDKKETIKIYKDTELYIITNE